MGPLAWPTQTHKVGTGGEGVRCMRRLPQGIRTLVRLYVVLVIPIFFGPYYSNLARSTQSFVFVLFFAIMARRSPLRAVVSGSVHQAWAHVNRPACRCIWGWWRC